MPTTTGDMLEIALAYAAAGWRIIPLKPRDKTPLIATGPEHEACSSDPSQIRSWWSQTPKANIGLVTGTFNDLLVLDFDGEAGQQEAKTFPLTKTAYARTGSGGWHFLYALGEHRFRNTAKRLAPHCDTRGCGGYIVAPGSIHPNGTPYTWESKGGIPRRGSLPPLPSKLVERLTQIESEKAEGSAAGGAKVPQDLPETIPEGTREADLVSLAGSLARRGLREAEILDGITAANARCVPPLLPDALRRMARSIFRSEQRKKASAEKAATAEVARVEIRGGTADWEAQLLRSKDDGPPKAIDHNAILVLENHPSCRDKIAWDEFAARVCLQAPLPGIESLGPFPRAINDADVIWIASWFQNAYGFANPDLLHRAILATARAHPFHPVRAYLNSLEWDGIERLTTWLPDLLGAEDTAYTRAVGRLFLISAVARIRSPGCQADLVPIFEGKQGTRKSTALRHLFSDPWFSDDLGDIRNKDAALQLHGKWGIEISELEAMSKAEINRFKSFVSRRIDHVRLPYAKITEDWPRHCVFAGTTNEDQYLPDSTGNRRYLPIQTGLTRPIDADGIAELRDALWAEAANAHAEGESWHCPASILADAAEEQEARYVVDSWEPKIREHLDTGIAQTTTAQILESVFQKDVGTWTMSDSIRVGKCLRRIGWTPKQERVPGPGTAKVRVYYPPSQEEPIF